MRTDRMDEKAFRRELAQRLSDGEKTNFFLTEQEYLPLLQQGRLSRMDFCGGVYWIVQEEACCRLYYFLQKEAKPAPLPHLKKPLLLEEVLLASRERNPSVGAWQAVGMQPFLERKRLYLMAKNVPQEERTPAFATAGMVEEILQVMQESFDHYTAQLPTRERLLADIAAKRVLVKADAAGQKGFLRFETERQGTMLWQIAVCQSARGQGIGEALVRDWLFCQRMAARRFQLWVRTDNTAALQLYDKLGFQPDGRIAPVMIRQDETKI